MNVFFCSEITVGSYVDSSSFFAGPPKPIAQNEAERLLNALEGMKSSPVVGGSKYHGATVSVIVVK